MFKPFLKRYPTTSSFANHKNRKPPAVEPGIDYGTPIGTNDYLMTLGTVYFFGKDGKGAIYYSVKVDNSEFAVFSKLYGIKNITSVKYNVVHLSKVVVKLGHYKSGILASLTGNTGQSTGAHTHITLKINNVSVNPAIFIDYLYGLKEEDINMDKIKYLKNFLTWVWPRKDVLKHPTYGSRPDLWMDKYGWLELGKAYEALKAERDDLKKKLENCTNNTSPSFEQQKAKYKNDLISFINKL